MAVQKNGPKIPFLCGSSKIIQNSESLFERKKLKTFDQRKTITIDFK
jgi:hypothetical protein